MSSAAPPLPSTSAAPNAASDSPGVVLGCNIADPGPGEHRNVALGVAGGRLNVPARVPERFPLVIHFHGGDPVRRLIVGAELNVVFVTIDVGTSSQRYETTANRELPGRIVKAVEEKTGRSIGKVVITAWSAGFGAVRSLLRFAPDFAQAYVLLDAVHTAYDGAGTLEPTGLAPFVDLVKRAKLGSPLVWLTHSSITPPGYASTTEVADALIASVGGRKHYGGLEKLAGLDVRTRFDEGAFHVRGTTGTDEPAHCAHLRMLPKFLEQEVLPAFERQ
ncbi:MAG: hypothetical protein FJ096_13620 [Deltaproteobacteria bacterium]|nr:hypothetical protein [Deltaproteobacteria bacterium]